MILITGGTGFVGRHFVQRARAEGIAVRALIRDPRKAQALKNLDVDLVQGDISDKSALESAAVGADSVVHLVGIIQEAPHVTFQDIHVEGTRSVLNAAQASGVRFFLYLSALGARPDAASTYHKTKWGAEELVRKSGIPFSIVRPSLIYGNNDGFTTRLTEAIKLSPFLPIIGSGQSRVQPISIDDVVSCMLKAVTDRAVLNATYEIGGPEQLTYQEITVALANAMGIHRPVLHLPLPLMRVAARLLELALPVPPLTTDQLTMLQENNICDMRDIREVFRVEPVTFREGLAALFKGSHQPCKKPGSCERKGARL